jgi:hypothetical protein
VGAVAFWLWALVACGFDVVCRFLLYKIDVLPSCFFLFWVKFATLEVVVDSIILL